VGPTVISLPVSLGIGNLPDAHDQILVTAGHKSFSSRGAPRLTRVVL
jgi:hypothetical protein